MNIKIGQRVISRSGDAKWTIGGNIESRIFVNLDEGYCWYDAYDDQGHEDFLKHWRLIDEPTPYSDYETSLRDKVASKIFVNNPGRDPYIGDSAFDQADAFIEARRRNGK